MRVRGVGNGELFANSTRVWTFAGDRAELCQVEVRAGDRIEWRPRRARGLFICIVDAVRDGGRLRVRPIASRGRAPAQRLPLRARWVRFGILAVFRAGRRI